MNELINWDANVKLCFTFAIQAFYILIFFLRAAIIQKSSGHSFMFANLQWENKNHGAVDDSVWKYIDGWRYGR